MMKVITAYSLPTSMPEEPLNLDKIKLTGLSSIHDDITDIIGNQGASIRRPYCEENQGTGIHILSMD
ncbi:MAG: hypothetical protein ACI4NM_12305, partial [Bullifex sp.]